MTQRAARAAAIVLLALAAASGWACSGGSAPEDGGAPAPTAGTAAAAPDGAEPASAGEPAAQVHLDVPSCWIGASFPVAAALFAPDGRRDEPLSSFALSSSDPSVLSLDGGGRVTLLAEGSASVRAAWRGEAPEGVVRLYADIPLDDLAEILPEGLDLGPDRPSGMLGVSQWTGGNRPAPADEVRFCSADPSVAAVSAGGAVTAIAPGETFAAARFRGNLLRAPIVVRDRSGGLPEIAEDGDGAPAVRLGAEAQSALGWALTDGREEADELARRAASETESLRARGAVPSFAPDRLVVLMGPEHCTAIAVRAFALQHGGRVLRHGGDGHCPALIGFRTERLEDLGWHIHGASSDWRVDGVYLAGPPPRSLALAEQPIVMRGFGALAHLAPARVDVLAATLVHSDSLEFRVSECNAGESFLLDLDLWTIPDGETKHRAVAADRDDIAFRSTDPEVVDVNDRGKVRLLSPGEATVYAHWRGPAPPSVVAYAQRAREAGEEIGAHGAASVVVRDPRPRVLFADRQGRLGPWLDLLLNPGEEKRISGMFAYEAGEPMPVRPDEAAFCSSDPAVVSVDGDGAVTALSPGAADILIRSGDAVGSADARVMPRLTAVPSHDPDRAIGFGGEVALRHALATVDLPADRIAAAEAALDRDGVAAGAKALFLALGAEDEDAAADAAAFAASDPMGRIVLNRVVVEPAGYAYDPALAREIAADHGGAVVLDWSALGKFLLEVDTASAETMGRVWMGLARDPRVADWNLDALNDW